MSIALESVTISRIERPGMHHGTVYGSPETGRSVFGIFTGDHRMSVKDSVEVRGGEDDVDSTSSSSIGENSDCSDEERDSEVQSSFKGPLDALEVLEEVLPIKRGVSKFYNGKSKSYTSLEVAACSSSIKDIVKPENAFTRKRKNLLAHSIFFDKNSQKSSRTNEGGLLKKPANRNHMGLALRMNGSGEHSPTPVRSRPPPPPPQNRKLPNIESSMPSALPSFSPWRSFSLSDLQCSGDMNAAAAAITCSDMKKNNEINVKFTSIAAQFR
ncbi:uncharacterized protein LOC124926714 [Impatiens glandulifera]|uniref:uncharacterized protein LOC124926714 n=1 Tax=Impatiens glandulifera TaxID=253017 RepID=UPI001FB0DA46|nr:uncharacterized protein LOC124926714 [Impatiens glandulifera]